MSENREKTVEELELKVQALSESFAQKSVGYENQIADMRVEFTLVVRQLQQKIESLEGADVQEEDSK